MSLQDSTDLGREHFLLEKNKNDAKDLPKTTNKEKRLAKRAEKLSKDQNEGPKRKLDVKNIREKTFPCLDGDDTKNKDQNEEDEEALSHKERRKRRKMEKSGHLPSTLGDERLADGEGDTSSTNKPSRSAFSLWIGNLSFRTNVERLTTWLTENGVDGMSRIYMPSGTKKFEHNKGFAYVDVADQHNVEAGLALSENHLDGRKLLIKSGSDFSGRPQLSRSTIAAASLITGLNASAEKTSDLTKTGEKVLRSQKHPPGPTIFFGNLSFNTTEKLLRTMIEQSTKKRKETPRSIPCQNGVQHAEEECHNTDVDADARRAAGIRKIRMGEFEDSGKCKGFAFVDFLSPEHATATLCDSRNSRLQGRELTLQYAGADAIRRGAKKHSRGESEQIACKQSGTTEKGDTRSTLETSSDSTNGGPPRGNFDPDAPFPRRHKENKEERQSRRSTTSLASKGTKRLKPGAALASAPRARVGIIKGEQLGVKRTFSDDESSET